LIERLEMIDRIKGEVRSRGNGNGEPEVSSSRRGDCSNSNVGESRHLTTLRETVLNANDYWR